MDAFKEELLSEEFNSPEEDILKDAWPLPQNNMIKEFEDYLLDIGVRI